MQLQMIWPEQRLHRPPSWTLPEGYLLRTYRQGDEPGHIRVMRSAGFSTWSGTQLQQALQRCLDRGLFFIVDTARDLMVATACAQHNPMPPLHPQGGELGWAACDPAYRGQRLGLAVCAAVTKRFLDAGYTRIFLRTDDHRLPAIKMYLNLGFQPLLHGRDMESRWISVHDKLGRPFLATDCVTADFSLAAQSGLQPSAWHGKVKKKLQAITRRARSARSDRLPPTHRERPETPTENKV